MRRRGTREQTLRRRAIPPTPHPPAVTTFSRFLKMSSCFAIHSHIGPRAPCRRHPMPASPVPVLPCPSYSGTSGHHCSSPTLPNR